jgi:hypothetical protein
VAEENEELRGRAKADLRNEQIRVLIGKWEKRRDELLDEVSFRKGQLELLEELIRQSYEKILDVNKEEKAKEEKRIQERLDELKKQAEVEEESRRSAEALALHEQKQREVAEGKRQGKPHPLERARDLQLRKAAARKKKDQEE